MTTDGGSAGRAVLLLVLAALGACGERTTRAQRNDVLERPSGRPQENALPGWTTFKLPIAGSQAVSLVPIAKYGTEDVPSTVSPQAVGGNAEQAVLSDHVEMDDTEGGELIVLDNRRAEIIVSSPDGEVLDLLRGGSGEGPGELRRTRSITVCRGGGMAVLDAGLNRVSIFKRGRRVVRAFRPEVASAYALVCADTTIWVHGRMKEGGEAVWRLDSIGSAVEGAIGVDSRDEDIASFGEAACGRYRRRLENRSPGKGAGHPSAELTLGSRGVMNRRAQMETAP